MQIFIPYLWFFEIFKETEKIVRNGTKNEKE
jgi:hypothetical protein